MNPSQSYDQIPPRLYNEVRSSASSFLGKFQGQEASERTFQNTAKLIDELQELVKLAGSIFDRFSPERTSGPLSVDPDSSLGRVLGVQASAEAFAHGLVVLAQNESNENALHAVGCILVVFLQSCERVVRYRV